MAKFSKKAANLTKQASEQSRDSLALQTEDTPSVSRYLSELKFKRTPFGGVDEADVWKKIEKLCELYEESIYTERVQRKKLEQAMAVLRTRAKMAKAREEDGCQNP